MKKKIIFILFSILLLNPLNVGAKTFYFNYSDYNYSNEPIIESDTMEVQEIAEQGKTVYKYRTRNYLTIPDNLIIRSKDFNLIDVLETNVDFSNLQITYHYDLEKTDNAYGSIKIKYDGGVISTLVSVDFNDYIEIEKEIIVKNYDFDIWDYIETNIEDKEKIEITGEYDLTVNKEYEILLKYGDIEQLTNIIVDIEENKKIINEGTKEEVDIELDKKEDVVDEVVINFNTIKNEKLSRIIKEDIESGSCVNNNYYEVIESCERVEYFDRIVPINNKVIYKDNIAQHFFYYVSYVFYGIVIILLSIIVVRKK